MPPGGRSDKPRLTKALALFDLIPIPKRAILVSQTNQLTI